MPTKPAAAANHRVFISCANSEFDGYRETLRGHLTSHVGEAKVQEDFGNGHNHAAQVMGSTPINTATASANTTFGIGMCTARARNHMNGPVFCHSARPSQNRPLKWVYISN